MSGRIGQDDDDGDIQIQRQEEDEVRLHQQQQHGPCIEPQTPVEGRTIDEEEEDDDDDNAGNDSIAVTTQEPKDQDDQRTQGRDLAGDHTAHTRAKSYLCLSDRSEAEMRKLVDLRSRGAGRQLISAQTGEGRGFGSVKALACKVLAADGERFAREESENVGRGGKRQKGRGRRARRGRFEMKMLGSEVDAHSSEV
ncbi:hypothetical protein CABS01_15283 [Colletotrichum abscissum]|uniref:Uncharacterized protein n=1 Tax=Colletotrichum abscissum TaxID=1671311 RepID=A0A9P9XSI4_9PEZI|nr:uncharacterized protein CABS01_15283 [Colletotrichum abscissum]KAI3559480.1 hypothetical protein CABS02_00455 [Colletotrichum abscissum]KAK1476748.1 hypothetical protein CABS01_15283 [Colletotrichum abscissum]